MPLSCLALLRLRLAMLCPLSAAWRRALRFFALPSPCSHRCAGGHAVSSHCPAVLVKSAPLLHHAKLGCAAAVPGNEEPRSHVTSRRSARPSLRSAPVCHRQARQSIAVLGHCLLCLASPLPCARKPSPRSGLPSRCHAQSRLCYVPRGAGPRFALSWPRRTPPRPSSASPRQA